MDCIKQLSQHRAVLEPWFNWACLLTLDLCVNKSQTADIHYESVFHKQDMKMFWYFKILFWLLYLIHITIKICCLKIFHSKIVLQQAYYNLWDIYIVTQVLKRDYVRTKSNKMLTLEPPSYNDSFSFISL